MTPTAPDDSQHEDPSRTTDVLVIGASAAGLAVAAGLRERGLRHEVLEATDHVGDSWRHHYDRLHLHTPKSTSALPGLAMPRDWPRYPSRDQVVQYLENYAQVNGIEPRFSERVSRLEHRDGRWVATTATGEWTARDVVVATGANRVPVRPAWPGIDDFGGDVVHSSEYRNGEPWRGRTVLVVGFGNSACEQAIDLVEHGVTTHMSVRSAVNVVPRDLLGVPILTMGILMRRLPTRFADAMAAPLIRLTVGDVSDVGLRKLPYGPNTQIKHDRHIPLLDIGTMDHLRAGRITAHPGIERFTGAGVVFTDGTPLEVDAVVLATGYTSGIGDFLVDAETVRDEHGAVPSGVATALPHLWFCGQFVAPSGMLREIGRESRRIAAAIATG
jgi:cation diffusion facilitator CzcD-associated flavoprotein CzcO